MCPSFRKLRSILPSIFLLLAFFSLANTARAVESGESVILSWDRNPEPDIAGYRVRFGRTSGALNETKDSFGSVTELPIAGLTAGETYYFAVLAYNWAGYESPLSDEVSYLVPRTDSRPTLVPELSVKSSVAGNLTNGQALGPAASAPIGSAIGIGTVILRNLGQADLSDLAFSLDGPGATSFNATRLASNSLAPGGILAINITFAPKTIGSLAAVLHITSKDPSNPRFDIPLSGSGLGIPRFTISYGSDPELARGQTVDFGRLNLWTSSVAKSFTVRNQGSAPLSVLSASITGSAAADFKAGALDVTPLAPGASRIFQVTFTPTADGVRSATLRLTTNDPVALAFDVVLNGSRIPKPQIGIGNPGGDEITDDSALMELSTVGTKGNASRQLTASNSTVEFGTLRLTAKRSSQTLTLRNLGKAALTNLKFTGSGSQAGDFMVVAPRSTTLAPGASTRFRVSFAPQAAGLRNATVTISSDSGSQGFSVSGKGISVPEIEIRLGRKKLVQGKAYVDLGKGQIGAKGFTQTLVIANVGSAKLKKLSLIEAGVSPGEFSVSRVHAKSLAPGKSAKFTITFRAGEKGIRWANLRVSSNDPDTKSFEILLTGTGTTGKVTPKSKRTKTRKSNSLTTATLTPTLADPMHSVIGTEVIGGEKFRTLTISRTPGIHLSAGDVQVSSDRVDWSSGVRHTTVLRDDPEVLKVRDNTPVTQDHKRFIRLKP